MIFQLPEAGGLLVIDSSLDTELHLLTQIEIHLGSRDDAITESLSNEITLAGQCVKKRQGKRGVLAIFGIGHTPLTGSPSLDHIQGFLVVRSGSQHLPGS